MTPPHGTAAPPTASGLTTRRAATIAVATVITAIVLTVVGAAPASAHAVLVSSSPGDGEQLDRAPNELAFNFTEGVSADLGGVTVLNAKGDRVDDGTVTQPAPEQLRLKLKPDLPDGTYVANYRIVSADGHPVSGALAFAVGTTVDRAGAANLTVADDSTTQAVATLARFITYLAALLAAGIAFFVAFIHDHAPERRRLNTIVRVAGAASIVGQSLVIATQAALASGTGLGAAFNSTVLTKTLGGSLGWASALIITGTAAVIAGTFTDSEIGEQVTAFYGSLAITVGLAFWGHSSESAIPWLSITTDALHATAAAVWFGGLVALALLLTTRPRAARRSDPKPPDTDDEPTGSAPDTVGIVVRFSTAATIAIVLVALAGTGMAWYELGSFDALVSSTYGRVLLVKIVAVAVIAGVGAYNHFRLVPAILDDEPEPPADGGDDKQSVAPPDLERRHWTHLLQSVRIEAAVIIAVLILTSFLVNLTPPRNSSASAGPYNGNKPFGAGSVALTVAPANAGSNSIHITYLDATGKPADIAQSVNIEMTLPDKGVGPLTKPGVKGGPGHFILNNTTDLSIVGTWNITLVTRLSDFEQQRATFQVPIAGG